MTTMITSDRAEAIILGAVREFIEDDVVVTPMSSFEALELDSLDLVEIRQVIVEELGVELTGEDVIGITTIGELCELVVRKSA